MVQLTAWVQHLVLLVLVVSFLELVAPENALRRYVQLVVGLLVLVAVLNPVVRAVRGGEWLSDALQTGAGWTEAPDQLREEGTREALEAANRQLQVDLFTDRLRAYLESELAKAAGERVGVAVRATADGSVQQVTVTAAPGRSGELQRRAADLAGVAQDKVLIVEEAVP
ncbi:MAG: stage III sporulation protein AF [Chitinophagales bacterium]